MEQSLNIPKTREIPPLYKFTAKAYLWMFLGLLCTAATGFIMISTGMVYAVFMYSWLPFVFIIAKIAVVVFLTSRIHQMSETKSKAIFIGYSVLTGITFSVVGLLFDVDTLFLAFGFSAVLFACLGIIGYTTKKDMTSLGPVLFGGLIALLIVSFIGIFINLSAIDLLISLVGVILFLGITVYDTQKMKRTYMSCQNDHAMLGKLSIFFALQLYLDFINIFLYLVRIMGRND